jgi:hypothetical protein
MNFMDFLWLLIVAGGPLILAIGFIYALFRRRISRRKFEAGERGARRLYDENGKQAPRS